MVEKTFHLNKLEALAEAATCRPWRYEEDESFPGWFNVRNSTAFLTTFTKENDAAFIVEACNSATYLIAEIQTLRERVQSLEKQRNWLAQKHAVACIDAACDSCTTHIGDCPICPISQETGLCIEVSEVTFINAAEQAAKETVE